MWVPEMERCVFPWNSVRLCSRFFLDTSKICNNWSLIFRKSYGRGKSIAKLFLTFLQKPPGFHTTAREPKRAQLAPTLQTPPKFHEKTPRERNIANMGAGEGKKKRNFGRSGGGGPAEGSQGSAQILDAPTKILNTHRTDTPHYNGGSHTGWSWVVRAKSGQKNQKTWKNQKYPSLLPKTQKMKKQKIRKNPQNQKMEKMSLLPLPDRKIKKNNNKIKKLKKC